MAPHGNSWTERISSQRRDFDDVDMGRVSHQGLAFKPHSTGMVGHLIHMVGAFVPVIAGEFIDDAKKYKKTVRLTSVAVAGAYEIQYMVREYERQKRQAEKLEACRGRE